MPQVNVCLYQEQPGNVPVRDWLAELRKKDKWAYAKCIAAIRMLAMFGHELRRPQAAPLRDGIYELRVRKDRVNYRILYFFHGRSAVVLAHGLTKEDLVPSHDINRAIDRKRRFEKDPRRHTAEEDVDDA